MSRGFRAKFPTRLTGNWIAEFDFWQGIGRVPTGILACFWKTQSASPIYGLQCILMGSSARFRGPNVGKKQSERSPGSAKSPRWGWSGVDKIVRPPSSEEKLKQVIDLLPSFQSPVEDIVAELQAIGERYSRYLHQDEFGPTRAEQMQALRDTLVPLGELALRLKSLPLHLRLLLSEELMGFLSAPDQLDVDPFACACRKSNSHIQMMKSAEKWCRQKATNGMYNSRRRRVFVD